MAQSVNRVSDMDLEMEEIDMAIITHNKMINKLKCRRYELLARKQDLRMNEVLECIVENGFPAEDLLGLVIEASKNNNTNLTA